jgi:hypothetical protein
MLAVNGNYKHALPALRYIKISRVEYIYVGYESQSGNFVHDLAEISPAI